MTKQLTYPVIAIHEDLVLIQIGSVRLWFAHPLSKIEIGDYVWIELTKVPEDKTSPSIPLYPPADGFKEGG